MWVECTEGRNEEVKKEWGSDPQLGHFLSHSHKNLIFS